MLKIFHRRLTLKGVQFWRLLVRQHHWPLFRIRYIPSAARTPLITNIEVPQVTNYSNTSHWLTVGQAIMKYVSWSLVGIWNYCVHQGSYMSQFMWHISNTVTLLLFSSSSCPNAIAHYALHVTCFPQTLVRYQAIYMEQFQIFTWLLQLNIWSINPTSKEKPACLSPPPEGRYQTYLETPKFVILSPQTLNRYHV